jgi:hypothetical protein
MESASTFGPNDLKKLTQKLDGYLQVKKKRISNAY